ncbi:MAG: VWA domain-containing protein [Pyrinomonadaceae bacterium]
MLKKALFVGLLMLLAGTFVWAQSGRRIRSAPTPYPSPEKTEDAGGYSESAPNRAVSIYARPKREKKSKADKKDKDQAGENSQTDADLPDGEEVVKIESSLITVPVSVYDRNGIYISGLEDYNFKIFEDGKEQEIAVFGTTDKPVTVVLVLDMSSSAAYKIEEIRSAASSFVSLLKPADSVMVINFDDRVNVLTDPTTDREKIYKAINRSSFGGGTALYDAVAKALGRKLEKVEGRKAVILFTDGVDTTSNWNTFESTLRDAEESDAMIFPIYYNTFLAVRGIGGGGGVMTTPPTIGIPGTIGGQAPRGTRSEDYARGRAYLSELAEITGGRVFRPDSTPGGLKSAFAGIAEELSRQYFLGYYPIDIGKDGDRKQIRVRVNRPNLIIRARDSYIVGANKTDGDEN